MKKSLYRGSLVCLPSSWAILSGHCPDYNNNTVYVAAAVAVNPVVTPLGPNSITFFAPQSTPESTPERTQF